MDVFHVLYEILSKVCSTLSNKGPGSEVINYMLNSDEHEISNAHKYKISRNSAFTRLDKPRMLFNVGINL